MWKITNNERGFLMQKSFLIAALCGLCVLSIALGVRLSSSEQEEPATNYVDLNDDVVWMQAEYSLVDTPDPQPRKPEVAYELNVEVVSKLRTMTLEELETVTTDELEAAAISSANHVLPSKLMVSTYTIHELEYVRDGKRYVFSH